MNFWQQCLEIARLVKVGDFVSYLKAAKLVNDMLSSFLATVSPDTGVVMMESNKMVAQTMTVEECTTQLEAIASMKGGDESKADVGAFPWALVLPVFLQILQQLLGKLTPAVK